MTSPILKPPQRLFLIMAGLFLGMILVSLGGCTVSDGVPRKMEADYGRSYTNNRMEMMLTPPNAVSQTPPVGLPPQTAKNVQERYDKSFKEKEEPPTIRWLFK